MLIGSTERPESNGTPAKLGKPAFQLRLCSIMGKATEMEHLATLSQESTNVRSGIHGPRQDFRMLVRRLGLADQTAEHTREGNSFLHGPSRRSGRQGLQVEGKVVLNGGRGLNGFDFQSGTDVGEGAGTEWKRLGMVSLPTLVLGTKIKGARVLQVGREDDGLVSSLPRKLHTEIPRVQRHKGKLQVLADEVFLSEGVEAVDGIAESACRAHMFPGESSQARYGLKKNDLGQPLASQHRCTKTANLLQRGVMGVLTGLTRTLSRWSYNRSKNESQVSGRRQKGETIRIF